MMIGNRLVSLGTLSLALLAWSGTGTGSRAGEPPKAALAGGAPVLDLKKSMWRFQLVRETAEILTAPGKVEKVVYRPKNWSVFRTKQVLDAADYTAEKAKEYRLPESTPADWAKPDFDDSQWWRGAGPPEFAMDEGWKLILVRGRFEVADPAGCQDLKLSATYRGAIAVYLNGEEVARKDMMAGQTGLGALAEPYPEAAHLSAKGQVLTSKEAAGKRELDRRLSDCVIPAAKLRKGENVLAVAVHRAPLDKVVMLRANGEGQGFATGWLGLPVGWSALGLSELTLSAPAGGAVTPATGPAKLAGLRLWNQSIVQAPLAKDAGGAISALQPVRIAAPRGGAGCGLVVAGAAAPIKGLKVQVGELKGPGTIPAAAVQVRYALPEGRPDAPQSFDALAETAPDAVVVAKDSGLAVQPLWISVLVPADAAPGDYSGTLAVSAEGSPAQTVQLKLKVASWKAPALGEGSVHNDFMQSPESVAMRYGVELWSDEHLKLLDRTFELVAPLGCRTLYVTAIRRTHLGNEQAMVRWVRGKDGALEPDLSIVEKYVDVARKRLGRIPSVVLYAWEAPDSQGHAGNPNSPSRTHDRPILLTLKNPKTGELREILGPDWGTPESQELWNRLIPAMQKLLKDRGMEGSLLVGLIGDHRPTRQAMSEFAAAGPGVLFAAHSHFYCAEHYGHKVGMCSSVWGIGCGVTLPEFAGAGHGWKSDFRLTLNSRYGLAQTAPPNIGMNLAEKWMAANSQMHGGKPGAANDGVKGLGRIGVDFWPVLKKDSAGNWRGQLCGRYPESYWGQLSLLCCTQWLLAPGPSGPVSTVRAEAMREGAQAMEARAVIDRALVDKDQRAKLGDDLASRCARFLDERQRLVHFSEGWQGGAFAAGVDWPEQTERLYRLAGEVAEKIK